MTYVKTTKNPVRVFKTTKTNSKLVSGYEIGIKELYPNIACLGKKKSGKTTVLINLMYKKMGYDTKVYIFSPTFYKDATWTGIRNYMDKKEIAYDAYPSIYEEVKDEDTGKVKLVNIVEQIYKSKPYGKGKPAEEDSEEDEEEDTKKKKKSKLLFPKILCVFDDISDELRDKTIETALKRNRHSLACNIISTQAITDLRPNSINQLDYCLIWGGIEETRLEKLHERLNISVNFTTFQSLYEDAVGEKYGFLLIDVRNDEFRKNFG